MRLFQTFLTVTLFLCLSTGAVADSGEEVPVYKEYRGAQKTRLPHPVPGGMTLEQAVQTRRSVRAFADRPLNLAQVARLLVSAYGITQRRGDIDHRGVASAGALYPLELYLVAANVDSLGRGLYHFQASDSSLELIQAGDFGERVYRATNAQDALESPPATIVITARFERTTARYADRGYQYVYMEVGSVCQSIYLQATALGLGTCAVGAFDDDAANRLLELDGRHEAVLLIMPVGYPTGK